MLLNVGNINGSKRLNYYCTMVYLSSNDNVSWSFYQAIYEVSDVPKSFRFHASLMFYNRVNINFIFSLGINI